MTARERLPTAYNTTLKRGALGSLRSTQEGFFTKDEILPFLNHKSSSMADLRKLALFDPLTSLQNSSVSIKQFHKNTESCDLWKVKVPHHPKENVNQTQNVRYPYNNFAPLGNHIDPPNKSRNPKFYKTLSIDTKTFHKDMGEFTHFNITYMKNNSCFPYLKKIKDSEKISKPNSQKK